MFVLTAFYFVHANVSREGQRAFFRLVFGSNVFHFVLLSLAEFDCKLKSLGFASMTEPSAVGVSCTCLGNLEGRLVEFAVAKLRLNSLLGNEFIQRAKGRDRGRSGSRRGCGCGRWSGCWFGLLNRGGSARCGKWLLNGPRVGWEAIGVSDLNLALLTVDDD